VLTGGFQLVFQLLGGLHRMACAGNAGLFSACYLFRVKPLAAAVFTELMGVEWGCFQQNAD
jgi:hypothetical protein